MVQISAAELAQVTELTELPKKKKEPCPVHPADCRTMHPSLFSLPRNDQSSATLLTILSPELRQMIFRHLLLPSYDKPGNRSKFHPISAGGCWISSQLLSCCQQLYVECEEVLYGEHKVRVELDGCGVDIEDCYFDLGPYSLDSYSPGTYKFFDTQPNLNLYDLATEVLSHGGLGGDASGYSQLISKMLPGIMRVRRTDIHVKCESLSRLWDCIRLLRDLVARKQITVYWELKNTKEDKVVDLVRSFYLLGCRSLIFIGLPPARPVITCANAISELVTSRRTVEDLYLQVHGLHSLIINECSRFAMPTLSVHDDPDTDYSSDEYDDTYHDGTQHEFEARKKVRRSDQLSERGDIADVWRMIRRGDTTKFRLWKKRIMCDIAKSYECPLVTRNPGSTSDPFAIQRIAQ